MQVTPVAHGSIVMFSYLSCPMTLRASNAITRDIENNTDVPAALGWGAEMSPLRPMPWGRWVGEERTEREKRTEQGRGERSEGRAPVAFIAIAGAGIQPDAQHS